MNTADNPATQARIAALSKLLDGPRDNALLRFSLGNEYLKSGDLSEAEKCYRAAVDRDFHFSAAWKALGKTLAAADQPTAALAAFHTGIGVASEQGDVQAAKEMRVFSRRLEKNLPQPMTDSQPQRGALSASPAPGSHQHGIDP